MIPIRCIVPNLLRTYIVIGTRHLAPRFEMYAFEMLHASNGFNLQKYDDH
jgi:hypothetical protein